MNEMLIAPFTEAEVRRALFQMHPTKAPGLDGLSALFYQSNWEIVGGDVVKEVLKCLNEGILNSAVNETLIVLIPKVHKVERVEDLRPISLCNVIMKIITKVLANRLKTILPTIISPSQSAFIKGRLITDNIIVAHEVAHFIKGRNAQKKGFLSLKLDLSKAYDRVEWHFVKEMMLKMGFAEAWVNKIMLCISTVSYKIRINGSTSEAVYPMRGLRQGDPISPYLFVICTEWLSHAIHIQQRQGIIEGIRICKNAPTITHLMFADDCLIFSKATREAVVGIKGLLKTYELVAGQKVNYSKSEIVFSKNVAGGEREELSNSLQVNTVQCHTKYLGLPMIFSHRKREVFKAIEERISKRVEDWKSNILSGAGREVLIKAVLQAIPLYAMSCFKIPISVCRRLVSIFLGFWWKPDSQNKGIHWVRADILFKEKEKGGLGFRKIDLMNIAMLAKQGWRILSEPSLLVSTLLKSKYFPNTDLFSAEEGGRPSYGWRGIKAALEVVKEGAWWNEEENRYVWRGESSGGFSVKSAYKLAVNLEKLKQPTVGEQSDSNETQRFWRGLWKLKVPPRVKLFGWRLFCDSLPTKRNLMKRGCVVQDKCCFCDSKGEDAIHLFKNCWWMRSLLNGFDIPDEVWSNQCDSPGYWLWLSAKFSSETQFRSLLYGLWLGWRVRNDLVHGKEGYNFQSLQLKLNFLLREFNANSNSQALRLEGRYEDFQGKVILCDGAYDPESRRAGFGVVVMQDKRIVTVRADWDCNTSSSFEAECKAVRMGMEVAQGQMWEKVLFCSDSREIVWALLLGSWKDGANVRLLKDCMALLDDHQGWQLRSIPREHVAVADWLAKKARVEYWSWKELQGVPSSLPLG
ncbi:unnamed protein product [Rhodiola kirilowii]